MIRIVIKRMIMMNKIKKHCKLNGLILKIYNKFYMFSLNCRNDFDFSIKTIDKEYKVKFFATLSKTSWVNFRDEYKYQICRVNKVFRRFDDNTRKYDENKIKPISVMKNFEQTENVVPVLLMCPVSIYEIRYTHGSHIEHLSVGDKIGEFVFTNTTNLLKML